ncbi:TetR/AcrR family transcriptional regulator [Streptomyces sp. MUM 178J]|uniref:TetR/AcrR family transcriptional regulator n=1 Tax=Streptomyces sp. MUM 178J TaxID=2791991 RepID=UPI001F043602|nr:TetR/AcrR family transcriptional regulator [Streptomyces sp. MUM 178J]WRQ82832.1 helix-turn-helix domain-containing protein [Streptomyces sp. MUM 178J]
MSPRPYHSGKRQAAADETRQRILAAARTLLSGASAHQVSVDAVAKAADVSRQTVYNAFGSKSGLLEALFDTLAARAGMDVQEAFAAPDAATALTRFTEAFCRFWDSDRTVIRRLRGMAVLDRDLDRLLRERDEMRRSALTELLRRFTDAPEPETVDIIWQLTGFEAYDALAGRDTPRAHAEATRTVTAAVTVLYDAATAGGSTPRTRR